MIARAVHPIPAPPREEFEPLNGQLSTLNDSPRLRRKTNDPAREYAQRPGAVEPLPNSVAALILCKKGWAKIERHQIKITLDGVELIFSGRDSVVVAAKSGTGERVLWAVNRRAPELLHLLTHDGRYIESVPRKGEATWFSQDEASQAAYSNAQAMLQRDAARLRDLHARDSAAATRDAQHNATEVHRLVQTFPSPEPAVNSGSRADLFPKADQLAAAMQSGEEQLASRKLTRRKEQCRKISPEKIIAALSNDNPAEEHRRDFSAKEISTLFASDGDATPNPSVTW